MSGAGVKSIARLMRHLSQRQLVNAEILAAECRIARSTAFEVLRYMEDAGFLTRDRQGYARAAAQTVAFDFAAVECESINGPAQAILIVTYLVQTPDFSREEALAIWYSASLYPGKSGTDALRAVPLFPGYRLV